MMRARLSFALIGWLLTSWVAAVALVADEGVSVLHWNDFHGQVLPRTNREGGRRGGIRAIARAVPST